MSVALKPLGRDLTLDELLPVLKDILADLEEQINRSANIYLSTDGKVPKDLQPNDILITAYQGNIGMVVKSTRTQLQLSARMLGGLMSNGTNFLGFLAGNGPPLVASLPNTNDWAFYKDTSGGTCYLAANFDGTIKRVILA